MLSRMSEIGKGMDWMMVVEEKVGTEERSGWRMRHCDDVT